MLWEWQIPSDLLASQCVSYRLVLFAGFGVFISLPSPPPLSLHNLDLGRFGFTFVPVEPERVVSIGFLPHYAKVAKTPSVKFSSDLNLRKETSELQTTTSVIRSWVRGLEESGMSLSPVQKHLNSSDEAQESVWEWGEGRLGPVALLGAGWGTHLDSKNWRCRYFRFWTALLPSSPNSSCLNSSFRSFCSIHLPLYWNLQNVHLNRSPF